MCRDGSRHLSHSEGTREIDVSIYLFCLDQKSIMQHLFFCRSITIYLLCFMYKLYIHECMYCVIRNSVTRVSKINRAIMEKLIFPETEKALQQIKEDFFNPTWGKGGIAPFATLEYHFMNSIFQNILRYLTCCNLLFVVLCMGAPIAVSHIVHACSCPVQNMV